MRAIIDSVVLYKKLQHIDFNEFKPRVITISGNTLTLVLQSEDENLMIDFDVIHDYRKISAKGFYQVKVDWNKIRNTLKELPQQPVVLIINHDSLKLELS